MLDIRLGSKLFDHEILHGRQVGGNAFENEIRLAGNGVAFTDLRPLPDPRLEGFEFSLGLALLADKGEEPDHPRLLQGLHPSQARRWRQADSVGELHIGHATAFL